MTTPGKSGKPSVEHIVLGAVLLVVLAVGGWFLLGPGSSAKTTSTATEPTYSRPTAAAGDHASPKPLKPTKISLVPMTKKAYLKAGNKICARMNAAAKKLGDYPSSPEAEAAFITKSIAITEKTRRLLVALPAPAASAARLASYYADLQKLDVIAKSFAKDLAAGDTAKAQPLQLKLTRQTDKTNAEFDAYGLTSCGSS